MERRGVGRNGVPADTVLEILASYSIHTAPNARMWVQPSLALGNRDFFSELPYFW